MSALTDYFTSLANKIRSLTGKSAALTPTQMVPEIEEVYDAGEAAGVAETKVGTAAAGDVLTGKTFTNASSVGASGSMANNGAVSKTLDATTGNQSYTIPAGYHNGSGSVGITLEEKTCTPSTTAQNITPTAGKVLSKVAVAAIATEEKTATAPATGTTDVTPTSGKYLTKVTVSPTPSESKSVTPLTTAQTVTPSSGKLLSSVSVAAIDAAVQEKTTGWHSEETTITPDSGKLLSSVKLAGLKALIDALANGAQYSVPTTSTGLINLPAKIGTFLILSSGKYFGIASITGCTGLKQTSITQYNSSGEYVAYGWLAIVTTTTTSATIRVSGTGTAGGKFYWKICELDD